MPTLLGRLPQNHKIIFIFLLLSFSLNLIAFMFQRFLAILCNLLYTSLPKSFIPFSSFSHFCRKCLPLCKLQLLLSTSSALEMTMGSKLRSASSNAMFPSCWRTKLMETQKRLGTAKLCGSQTMQPALCSAGCTKTSSPTIMAETLLPFTQLSL